MKSKDKKIIPFSRYKEEKVEKPIIPEVPVPEIPKNDWRDKYEQPKETETFRLENTPEDSTLNRMIQLRNVENTDVVLGEPGKLYYDKTNKLIKFYVDDTIGWVNIITSNSLEAIVPHLMQFDSTDQAIANVNNAQVITFDTDVHHHNITRTSASRFTIVYEGSYLIAFSGVAVGTTSKRLEVWLRVNGDDVANSNTPYTFKGTATIGIVAVTFIQHFNAGDYFEFWTWGDDVSCKWDATAAGSSPTRPAIPSIIITCNYLAID